MLATSANSALIVPTLNAGPQWREWIEAVGRQSLRPGRILVIDSSSTDDTVRLAHDAGFELLAIPRAEFGHGRTRQLGVERTAPAEFLIFMTQDAILARDDAFEELLRGFSAPKVAAAYGRQLPHPGAGAIASHARAFNYPAEAAVRSMADAPRLGIKTSFLSNSFAAWRRTALEAVGGFDPETLVNEDALAASRLLLDGWEIAYRPSAEVFHSHDYTPIQDFKRYFDIGIFHRQNPWIRERFGKAEGEGGRFVRSEMAYLANRAPWLVPSALLRTGLKWAGYRLGVGHQSLPPGLARRMSQYPGQWRNTRTTPEEIK